MIVQWIYFVASRKSQVRCRKVGNTIETDTKNNRRQGLRLLIDTQEAKVEQLIGIAE